MMRLSPGLVKVAGAPAWAFASVATKPVTAQRAHVANKRRVSIALLPKLVANRYAAGNCFQFAARRMFAFFFASKLEIDLRSAANGKCIAAWRPHMGHSQIPGRQHASIQIAHVSRDGRG